MTPTDETFQRLECPVPEHGAYDYLRSQSRNNMDSVRRRKYFFALNLHSSVGILPRLLGSVIEAMRFLGPSQCALSIVEGRSDDGTIDVLRLLIEPLKTEGIAYFLESSDENPETGDRIERLAGLRNLALEPLVSNAEQYTNDTTVIFLNDVSLCMEDILELLYQQVYQKADMVCGMDWKNLWRDPTFYDVWVARGMNGDTFFNIPPDGNWDSAWNLFWNDQETRYRFDNHIPFQVFSCWNGATAFTAQPFLQKMIKFRHAVEGECYQGEPYIFCKEMWHLGYGKIAVVPSVNLEYSDDGARAIKQLRGYVSTHRA
ncbi:Alpha-1,3-mannosyltransferase CMT1 [Lachnellula suecica]|uniref:Alpha-1,3-mannosyltransferase CMT1 n=1 Tax=Lachnellula suecica TaxID=602035 RepID=A0A8T9CD55_9HELO|nr:Alpha-1,3-mannosyltransferase CMT1 [Lachnellula suecica]